LEEKDRVAEDRTIYDTDGYVIKDQELYDLRETYEVVIYNNSADELVYVPVY
jgi:hypothetical protein